MKIEIRWKCYENAVDGLCVGVGMVMDGNVSCIGESVLPLMRMLVGKGHL